MMIEGEGENRKSSEGWESKGVAGHKLVPL